MLDGNHVAVYDGVAYLCVSEANRKQLRANPAASIHHLPRDLPAGGWVLAEVQGVEHLVDEGRLRQLARPPDRS